MRLLPLFAFIMAGCSGLALAAPAADIAVSSKQIQALGIKTAPLQRALTASGNLLPAQVMIPSQQIQVISAPLAGMVESVLIASGQPVKAGQPLLHLQSPALAELQRDYMQTQLQAQLAQESLKRDEALYKDGIIAQSRYQTTRNNAAIAGASASEKRQALRMAGLSDNAMRKLSSAGAIGSRLEMTSPLTGEVLEQMVVPGQRVDAATPLFKLARLSPLWLEIQLPLSLADGIAAGSSVSVPSAQASGKVLTVGRQVSEGNQTILVRAEITSGAERLRPGQYTEASIATGLPQAHWSVPNSAIVRQDKQAYVFVQTAKGFRAQPVSVISQTAAASVIGGPLKGTEIIVTQGSVALKAAWQGLGGGEE